MGKCHNDWQNTEIKCPSSDGTHLKRVVYTANLLRKGTQADGMTYINILILAP